jgi:heat-inducible transcriptional repressor
VSASERTFDSEHDESTAPPLSEREQNVLQLVVKNFIETAGPVGSRSLVRKYGLDLSPASIRNTMSDLEEMGYLDHPYTSAGRMPTELGYRTFVDALMGTPELSASERRMLKIRLAQLVRDTDKLLRESSRLLSQLTDLLGVALSPRLSTGVMERLDVVPLTGGRLMFVISVRGGMVKTIVVEFESDINPADRDRVVSILNERLAGLTLHEIRQTHEERVRGIDDPTGIVRLVLEKSPRLFSEPSEGRLRHGGTQNILRQPEFQEPDDMRHLMEVIEDETLVVRVLESMLDAQAEEVGQAFVSIGSESRSEEVNQYSIVVSPYQLGDSVGTLGVIGPTRMNYGRVVALVQNMAAMLNRPSQTEAA